MVGLNSEAGPHFEDCEVCDKSVQFGPHVYELRKLRGYGVFACRSCTSGNYDGWGPVRTPRIIQILDAKGIKHPPRNLKGWLPLEF
jgi:hypothetical protein